MKEKSIRNIRQEFKDKGIFYTPPKLAEKLKSYVDVDIKTVYDPTCGAGNLLKVFPDDVKKYGQELDEEQLDLIGIPNFTGYAGDTLADDKFSKMKFDCIVANPPFSIKWNPDDLKDDVRFKDVPALPPPSKADWAFMIHCLHHLNNNGIAVVLEFPGILYRGNREKKVRQWFIENNYIDRVVNIPGNTFEDTNISTCIIVLRKNKPTSDIIFEDGEVEKVIQFQEVKDNDFCLSVSYYIEEKIEKEEIDPIELEKQARKSFLTRLRKELEFDKIVCQMEGLSIKPFIDEMRKILDEYYKEVEKMKLMLFTGSWCQPCKQMKGIVKEVADSHDIELVIYDVEKDADIANAYMIRGVPTLLIIGSDGEIVDRATSLVPKEWIVERIKED